MSKSGVKLESRRWPSEITSETTRFWRAKKSDTWNWIVYSSVSPGLFASAGPVWFTFVTDFWIASDRSVRV